MKPIQIVIIVVYCFILTHSAPAQTKPDITLYGRMQLMGFGQSVNDQVESNERVYLYLKQARFGITGTEEDIKLDIQVAFGGEDVIVAPNPGISLQLLDFSVDAPLVSSIRFKAGQFKVPYGREGLANSGYLSFGDRSIQYNASIVGRDVGGVLYGSLGTLTGALGVFTGGGRDIPIKYLPEKLGLPMVVLRAGINDGYDDDILTVKQTDYNVSSGSAFYVNALYTKDSRIGHSTVLNVKSSDKSLLLDGNWNPFIAMAPLDRGTLWQLGADAAYRSSMSGTCFLFGEAEINFGGFKNIYGSIAAAGGRIQVGIDQRPFEFAIRYAFIQPDSKFAYVAGNHQSYPLVNDQLIHEVTLGASYFLKNHIKLTADLPILIRVPVINDPFSGAYVLTQQPDQVVYVANGGKIDRQNVLQARLQLQYIF